jgi:hypothetical protein
MPTAKPRVSVTLDQESYQVLSRLSEVSGDSMSSLLSGLVDATRPSLERMVLLLERAQSAKGEIHEGLRDSIDKSVVDLQVAHNAMLGQFDLLMGLDSSPASVPQGRDGGAERGVRRAGPPAL